MGDNDAQPTARGCGMEFHIAYGAPNLAVSTRRCAGARAALLFVREIQVNGLTVSRIDAPDGRQIDLAELEALANGDDAVDAGT
jgi:hypothetical protein